MVPTLTGNKYLDIFLALVLSTTVLPIPEEVPVLWAGVECGHSDTEFADDRGNPGRVRWWVMLPVVIVGAVLGDIVLYVIGRKWGQQLLQNGWVKRRFITPETRASIEKNFARHGIKVLLGVRLLPGIRGPVFFMAGSVRMPLWQFIVADLIYAIPIVNLMFWSAYWLTEQISVLVNQINTYKSLVMSHLLAALLGALIYRYLLARHVPTGDVSPIIAKPAEAIGHALESAVDVFRHHDRPADHAPPPAPPEPPKIVPPG